MLRPIKLLADFEVTNGITRVMLVSLFFLLPGPVLGQEESNRNKLSLTLQEVFSRTLQNNADIRQARLDLEIARAEQIAAPVDFDYHALMTPFVKRQWILSNSSTSVYSERRHSSGLSLGLKTKFSTGTNSELSLQALRSTSDSSQSFYPSWYQSGFQLKFSQPLLKGGGTDFNGVTERKAIAKVLRYSRDLKETIDKQIIKAGNLFWDLYFQVQRRYIDAELLKTAEETFRSDLALFKAGRRSEVDLARSTARIESTRAKLLLDDDKIQELSEQLERALISPQESEKTPVQIRAKTEDKKELVNSVLQQDYLYKNADSAMDSNPKLLRLKQEVAEAELDCEKAKNSTLPQLDLGVEFLSSGLNTELSRALSSAVLYKLPSWEITLSFSFPLGNNTAEGESSRSFSVRQKKEMILLSERRALESDLNKGKNTLKTSKAVLASIVERIGKQEQIVEIKKSLYQAGRLSLQEYYEGLDALSELESAQFQEITAFQKQRLRMNQILGVITNY